METTPANEPTVEDLKAARDMLDAQPVKAAEPAFDLDKFDVLEKANEGVILEMKSADGKPTGLFLKLLGRDSDAFREVQFRHQTRRMNAMGENEGKFVYDAEQTENDALDLLSACVVSWSVGKTPWLGHVIRGGKKVSCTKAEVTKLFRQYPPFREQADMFIGDRKHFLKG